MVPLFRSMLLLLLVTLLSAEKVQITSDAMKAVDAQKQVQFIGNVTVKQQEDWIHGDKVVVYFDENNETKKYEAAGKVTFEIKKKKNFYKGSANKVIYLPFESKYILSGKAIIDDVVNKRHIAGEEIMLDTKTGNANVEGKMKEPVKFIFDLEEQK